MKLILFPTARPERVNCILKQVEVYFDGAEIICIDNKTTAERIYEVPPALNLKRFVANSDKFTSQSIEYLVKQIKFTADTAIIPVTHFHPRLYDYYNILECAKISGAEKVFLQYADDRIEIREIPKNVKQYEEESMKYLMKRKKKAIKEVAEFTGENESRIYERLEKEIDAAKQKWLINTPKTREEIDKFYADNHFYIYEHIAENYFEGARTNYLRDLLAISSCSTRVLDFGCGIASLALSLAPLVKNTTLVEISPRLLGFALWRFNRHNLTATGVHSLSELKENKFDIIIATDVLEHIPEPVETIKNLYSLMADDAFLAVRIPFDRTEVPFHLSVMSKTEYENLMQELGLERIKSQSNIEIYRRNV